MTQIEYRPDFLQMAEVGCVVCGQVFKDESNAEWLEMNAKTGQLVLQGEVEESQGCFPVGSGCYRKLMDKVKEYNERGETS